MILVCDLGNTNVVFGFYEKDTFISSFRLVSSNLMGLDEYVAKLNSVIKDKNIDISKIEGAIMSSVMPSISKIIKDAIKISFKVDPLVLGAGVKTGMAVLTDNPSEVGTDLVASCVGAVSKYGKPLIEPVYHRYPSLYDDDLLVNEYFFGSNKYFFIIRCYSNHLYLFNCLF